MPIARQNFSIPPLNDSNTSTNGAVLQGGFTHTKGNPTIKFSIPAQDRMFHPTQMYLTGRVLHCNADGSVIDSLTNLSVLNGANLSKPGNLNVPNWNGFQSLIQKVMIQSKKSPVEIMNVNNYPTYSAIRLGNTNNDKDYLTSPLSRYSAAGENGLINRHSVVSPDATAGASGKMTNLDNFNDEDFGQGFSFRIDTGMLNVLRPLHLGEQYLGGLMVSLFLNVEGAVYNQRFLDIPAVAAGGNVDGTFYRIKGLRLEGRYDIPTPQEVQEYPDMLPLQDRINLINDITASVNVTTYTPQLNFCKSFVNLFLDQDQENTIQQNQFNFRVPLGLENYTQNKNSVRTPEDFVIEAVPSLNVNTDANGVSYAIDDLATPIYGEGLAEVRNRFQRALLDGELPAHTSASVELAAKQLASMYQTRPTGLPTNVGTVDNNNADLMGIGLDYTHGIASVSNFVNQDYALRLKSGVDSGSSIKFPVRRKDKFEVQQTFVRDTAMLNSKTLQKVQ